MKASEGNWKGGKQTGVWTYWNKNGTKESEGHWKEGKQDGLSTYWDKEGNVTKTETYKNDELVT